MAYNKKEFIDLLLEYRSDESKKARRNVTVISFVILTAWYLNLHLSNMTLLGMNISKASEVPVLVVAFVLLVYWSSVFLLAWIQDSEIQKERSLILNEQVTYLLKRLEMIEEARKENDNLWPVRYPDHSEVRASVEAYQLQQQRTKRAVLAVMWMRRLEFYVPLALSAAAVLVLMQMLRAAL
jgi:hypothetical protein